MTSTRSMDEEQVFKSYASHNTDPALKEEQKIKETTQQPLIKGGKQLTLQDLPSSTKKDSKAMNDEFGILALGTSHLGPRTLLHIIENPWKSMVKVTHSTGTAQQPLLLNGNQQTLHELIRASLCTLGIMKDDNGISTYGSSCGNPRVLLLGMGRPQEVELKVLHSTTCAQQYQDETADQQT